ncbi:MAG TPA: hypothetical protein IAC04_05730 [Candidatus Coprenecus stercoravium]|uniref:Uncharacterized protein n=1 Tax=Candidatus Coprenecus stercoravium TaxID=2840735 RepID=A0A9D2KA76_9BACT|nr:hypothetical protein [Candidatus Coprenecus stercoravium]
MHIPEHIHKTAALTIISAVLCIIMGYILTSCRGSEKDIQEAGEVHAVVHINTGASETKAVEDTEINSIAIFAFSGDNLVGHLYESDITAGKTTFPFNLTSTGAIDFYVIANPDKNFFRIVDENGNEPDFDNPSGITPGYLNKCRIELTPDNEKPDEKDPWYAPMTNLPGAGNTNRRFVVSGPGWVQVDISLTRAVSKLEVWFRSNNEYDYNKYRYYSIDHMLLKMPVTSSNAFIENQEAYTTEPTSAESTGPFVGDFMSYDKDNIPDDFYSEKYFKNIWTYYIFSNLYGGSHAGEAPTVPDRSTVLTVNYSFHEPPSYTTSYIKDIYLPACERNTLIKVWCALNDNTDRSFTYTVSDWDETVYANVPDFN